MRYNIEWRFEVRTVSKEKRFSLFGLTEWWLRASQPTINYIVKQLILVWIVAVRPPTRSMVVNTRTLNCLIASQLIWLTERVAYRMILSSPVDFAGVQP